MLENYKATKQPTGTRNRGAYIDLSSVAFSYNQNQETIKCEARSVVGRRSIDKEGMWNVESS
jgi:hypothetical protein